MKKTMSLLAGLLCVGSMAAPVLALTATQAGAADATPVTGQVEICKALTAPPAGININTTATFVFTVSNDAGAITVDVPAGSCSGAITVTDPGSAVITETGYLSPAGAFVAIAPTFSVTSITELPGQSYLVTPTAATLAAGTATVNLAAGQVDAVTFTNAVNTGYVEVCKQAAAGSGLTGSFGFALSGPDAFSTSATVAVGSCSLPILVPAGPLAISESGTNLYVTGIAATFNGTGNALVTSNLVAGTATVTVNASTNVSNQTDVTYTNNVVSLKVCKVWDGATIPTTQFPFTEAVVSGAAGPNTAPAAFSLTAGTAAAPICSNPVAYRPGTVVSVTEGIVQGTKVESISAVGAESTVTGSLSLPNRTESFTVGNPTTGTGTTDEAIITFVDEVAAPGQLKICKLAGTTPGAPVVPASGVFSFTVTQAGSTAVLATANVPLGACVIVVNSTNGGLFAFNQNLTITETGTPSNVASAITVIPTNVTVLEGGVSTTSNEVAESAINLGTVGNNASANVLVSEGVTTEVDFTNVDPPVVVTSPGGVTVTNPGGPNAGLTTAPTAALATQVAATIPALVASSKGSMPTITSSITLTSAQRKALLKKDNKALVNVQSAITKWTKTAAHTKGLLHKTAEHRLLQLKSEAKVLNSEIKVLK